MTIILLLTAALALYLLGPAIRRAFGWWLTYCRTSWAQKRTDDAYHRARRQMDDVLRRHPRPKSRWDIEGF